MIQERHNSLILDSNAAPSPWKTREKERKDSFTHFPLLNTEKLTLWDPRGEKSDDVLTQSMECILPNLVLVP